MLNHQDNHATAHRKNIFNGGQLRTKNDARKYHTSKKIGNFDFGSVLVRRNRPRVHDSKI
jgi:hypothetical protein